VNRRDRDKNMIMVMTIGSIMMIVMIKMIG
jgi:hypothetical protein